MYLLYGKKYNKSAFILPRRREGKKASDIILFVTSNHQTTNLVSPNFSTVVAVETEKQLFIGPKQVPSQFWSNEKFVLFFNCSN